MPIIAKGQPKEGSEAISWDVTKEEMLLVIEIASRAKAFILGPTQLDLEMCVTACHANGCPLDLEALAKADDFTLLHDVLGIVRHMDYSTGRISKFLPRTALGQGRKEG